MGQNIFNWVTIPLILGIWLYIMISVFKEYSRLRKVGDSERAEALEQWKIKSRRFVLIWVLTIVLYFAVSMIVDSKG